MNKAHDQGWIRATWAAPRSIVAGTTLRTFADGELPLATEPCRLNQVHGNRVVVAERYDAPPDADGSFSNSADILCTVRTADCMPVLLCSRDGAEFAAAHAGWRGMAAGIIENTVARLDADGPDILAWLGPAISQPRFEVGREVREAFVSDNAAAASAFEKNDRGRWQADLYALARLRLAAAGVEDVAGGGFCTYDDPIRFFSYRRNPNCGRMTSFIGRVGP